MQLGMIYNNSADVIAKCRVVQKQSTTRALGVDKICKQRIHILMYTSPDPHNDAPPENHKQLRFSISIAQSILH